ncbi:threonine aldolase family protein [Peribacillus sp. SCS-37]|uniref:threonine aldolase family protein n=1 Tax=Paraperibacillus esterisolvens TaxID=3115296 RepID=UPI003906B339
MGETVTLLDAFKKTELKLNGHGNRNAAVLLEAFKDIGGEEESDIYGTGNFIEKFEQKMADYLGKESAVFFSSGTMAQQIALRIWCEKKGVKRAAYHPLSHLEIHEEDGLKVLHGIETVLLADKDRLITLEDVMGMDEEVSCLLLELPQREIGGQLPDYETLQDISAFCRKQGIKLQLDGARLFEILPYYGRTAAEICELFDSVYVSFYKGIGGLAGAILAGDKEFTAGSKVWKRRHGGDLISLYPYIVTADHYFNERIGKMASFYEGALELASLYNSCRSINTLPSVPVSNMFHVHIHLPQKTAEAAFVSVYEETGIGLTGYLKEISNSSCSYEVSIGDAYGKIPKEKLEHAFRLLDRKLSGLHSAQGN